MAHVKTTFQHHKGVIIARRSDGKTYRLASGILGDSRSQKECLDDMDFIAAACNSYPDLVKALKLCAAVCAGETLSKDSLTHALEAARAVLPKALPTAAVIRSVKSTERRQNESPVSAAPASGKKSKLKVFGGTDFIDRKQVSVVVAASSIAQLIVALNGAGLHVTRTSIKNHWSETGNKAGIAAAMSKPGTIFYCSDKPGDRVYLPVKKDQST